MTHDYRDLIKVVSIETILHSDGQVFVYYCYKWGGSEEINYLQADAFSELINNGYEFYKLGESKITFEQFLKR